MNRPVRLVSTARPFALRAMALGTVTAFALAACGKTEAPQPEASAPPPAPAAAPVAAPAAPVPVAYQPPPAEQLYQMVAPIALYPDKLVAQVLAASTFPEQVSAAQGWRKQNAGLKAGPLADAANQQPWDPSVKSLTAFAPVLDQMASNIEWTRALGQAYYNDPDDVMNAIQVMRQRAQKAGQLKSSKQLRVAQAGSAPPAYHAAPGPAAPVYGGPVIVEPPQSFITIEPSEPDLVYVPAYDPREAYGEPLPAYAGYDYNPPVYWAEPQHVNPVVVGALAFGTGVVVSSALQRHDWGWRNWGMHWGGPGWRDRDRGPDRQPPGWDRPAVVFNNNVWVPPAHVERGPRFAPGGNPQAMWQAQRQQQAQQQQLAQQQQVQAVHQQQAAQMQQAAQQQMLQQQQVQAARQQQAQMLQAQQAQQARQAQMAQQQQQGRMQQLQAQQQQAARAQQDQARQLQQQQLQLQRGREAQLQAQQQQQQAARAQQQQAQLRAQQDAQGRLQQQQQRQARDAQQNQLQAQQRDQARQQQMQQQRAQEMAQRQQQQQQAMQEQSRRQQMQQQQAAQQQQQQQRAQQMQAMRQQQEAQQHAMRQQQEAQRAQQMQAQAREQQMQAMRQQQQQPQQPDPAKK